MNPLAISAIAATLTQPPFEQSNISRRLIVSPFGWQDLRQNAPFRADRITFERCERCEPPGADDLVIEQRGTKVRVWNGRKWITVRREREGK